MSRIGKLLSFVRGPQSTSVKVDLGGGEVITAEHMASPGNDSHPLPGDLVALVPTARAGGHLAVGYLDSSGPASAAPGDTSLYSRDSSGAVAATVSVSSDGTITLFNAAGSLVLGADGNVTVSGTLTASSINAPLIQVAGAELAAHLHGGVTSGGSNTAPLV